MTDEIISDPIHIVSERAGAVESAHLVDAVICDAAGRIVKGYGDYDRLVFPRSAIKPLQAIALVEYLIAHDATDRLSAADYSVICASHNGEESHIEVVADLLARFDIAQDCFECGAHWSNHQPTCIAQARERQEVQKIHNNCSGKHAGMLVLGKLLGCDLTGYAGVSHQVQQTIITPINDMADMSVLAFAHGIDGCGAPAFSAPLFNWARAFAQFTKRSGARGQACRILADAIAAEPFLMAGSGRCCSAVNAAYGADVTVKIGAEGVYGIAANRFGLGAMLKVRDGNMNIAGVALGVLLSELGYETKPDLAPHFTPVLTNWAGDVVGKIQVS